MLCYRFSLANHLTEESYQQFAQRAKIPQDLDPVQVLENLHLVRSNEMTNAGAWLLAEDIRTASFSAHITCALFQENTLSQQYRRDWLR